MRKLLFLLPRNVVVKSRFRGKFIYSILRVERIYNVRIRDIRFWNIRDAVFFRIIKWVKEAK